MREGGVPHEDGAEGTAPLSARTLGARLAMRTAGAAAGGRRGDPLDDELAGIAHAQLVRAKRSRRLGSLLAAEDSDLLGIIRTLAERAASVRIGMQGRTLRGRIDAVGDDVLSLRGHGARRYLTVSAVDWIAADPDSDAAAGATTGASGATTGTDATPAAARVAGLTLAEVLRAAAAERAVVAVRTRSGDVLAGRVRSCGADVAVLDRGPSGADGQGDQPTGATQVLVPFRGLVEVEVRDRLA